jgi:uncharacterized membrane protein
MAGRAGCYTAPMATVTETSAPAKALRERIDSVDLLRGLVMVIMALDHVRDFFHADAQLFSPEDLTRTNGMLFFTRWITHFCAPVFVFLAGLSVHFYAPRRASLAVVSRFLVTRGLWLIFLEWTVVYLAFSFNFSYHIVLLQVLWAMGWSMIVLAALIWLPRPFILAIALALIALHNAFDSVTAASFGSWGWLWSFLHVPTFFASGGRQFYFLYPLIPWAGVMAAGHCFGPIMQLDAARRRRILVRLGIGLTTAFFVLRLINLYGDTRHWSVQDDFTMTVVSFFNTSKYPPSLLYLLMTLGPALLVLAALDRVRVGPQNLFRVFGRVPLFYYLVHFYAIHALAVVLGGLRYNRWDFFFQFPTALLGFPARGFPSNYGYNLAAVYLIWISLVCALYFPCRWYMNFKNRHHSAWLSYF